MLKVVSKGLHVDPVTGKARKSKALSALKQLPTVLECLEDDIITMEQDTPTYKVIEEDEDHAPIFQAVGDEIEEETVVPVLCAVKLLEKLAKQHEIELVWDIKEMDTGLMCKSTYFKVQVTAGHFTGSSESISKQAAKEMAADKLLINLKEGRNDMPEHETINCILDETNDPVHLLNQYAKGLRLNLPMYSHMCLKDENGIKEHVFQCFLQKQVKEGRASNKDYAKRLAAFEMLDYIISKNEGATNDDSIATNYASYGSETVQSVRDDSSKLENSGPLPKPFEVLTRKSSQPNEPSNFTIRRFYNTVTDPTKKGAKKDAIYLNTRHMVEIQATFEYEADSDTETRGRCIENAKNFKDSIESYFKNVPVVTVAATEDETTEVQMGD